MLIPECFPSTTFEVYENRIYIVEWRVQIDVPEVKSSWYTAHSSIGFPVSLSSEPTPLDAATLRVRLSAMKLPPPHSSLLKNRQGIYCAGGRGAQKASSAPQRTLRHPLRPAACDDALGYRWSCGGWQRLTDAYGRRCWLSTGYNDAVRKHAWVNSVPCEA